MGYPTVASLRAGSIVRVRGKVLAAPGGSSIASEILGSQAQVFTELTRVGQLAGYFGRPGMLNWKKKRKKKEKCVMQYAYSE